MQINSLQSVGAVQQAARTTAIKGSNATQTTPTNPSVEDQLDLSVEAHQLLASQDASGSGGDIRTEKVAAIREAINNGTYETPDKLSTALDKLLDSLL